MTTITMDAAMALTVAAMTILLGFFLISLCHTCILYYSITHHGDSIVMGQWLCPKVTAVMVSIAALLQPAVQPKWLIMDGKKLFGSSFLQFHSMIPTPMTSISSTTWSLLKTSTRCQINIMHIPTASITLSAPTVLKANACSNKNTNNANLYTLHEILPGFHQTKGMIPSSTAVLTTMAKICQQISWTCLSTTLMANMPTLDQQYLWHLMMSTITNITLKISTKISNGWNSDDLQPP